MSSENQNEVTRRRALYATVAAVAGLGGATWAWKTFTPAPMTPADQPSIWPLSFETPSGERLLMQSLQGRPLLLNFWATWCPPCVEELPLLDAFYKENASKGWQVLGLAVDRLGPVQDFLRKYPLTFPIALADMAGLSLSKSMGNLSGGLPFTVVLGADGQIRHRKIGKVSAADLTDWRALK